jgi:hypothetical protein
MNPRLHYRKDISTNDHNRADLTPIDGRTFDKTWRRDGMSIVTTPTSESLQCHTLASVNSSCRYMGDVESTYGSHSFESAHNPKQTPIRPHPYKYPPFEVTCNAHCNKPPYVTIPYIDNPTTVLCELSSFTIIPAHTLTSPWANTNSLDIGLRL